MDFDRFLNFLFFTNSEKLAIADFIEQTNDPKILINIASGMVDAFQSDADKAFAEISKENNKKSIQLDIRETQSAAIQLFENKGFSKWGENPSYAFINGTRIKGYYYFKDL